MRRGTGPPKRTPGRSCTRPGSNRIAGSRSASSRLPGCDLSADGVLARHRIGEIEDILLLLTGELTWKTAAAACEDAIENYRDAFESDRIARLVDELAAR